VLEAFSMCHMLLDRSVLVCPFLQFSFCPKVYLVCPQGSSF
jgi:hypothetical protein